MRGDACGFHSGGGDVAGIEWVKARRVVKLDMTHPTALMTKTYPACKSNEAKAEKP